MNDQEVEVVHVEDMAEVSVTVPPEVIIGKAKEMAKILNNIVKQAGLSQRFGNKEYLQFEAWQTIGRFHNCTPVTEWTRAIKQDGYEGNWGWECRVNVISADGQLVGSAEGMCCRDESNWKKRNDYALRSMAQTRTASKALRSCFAWVAVLAGYEATPAEEMKAEYVKGGKPKEEKPEFVPITPDQKAKIVEMFKAQGYEKKEATKLYREHLGSKPSKGKATAFLDNFYTLIPEPGGGAKSEPPDKDGTSEAAEVPTPSPGLDKGVSNYLHMIVEMQDFTLEKYREVKDIYMDAELPWQKKWDLLVQAKEYGTIIKAMVKAIKEAAK